MRPTMDDGSQPRGDRRIYRPPFRQTWVPRGPPPGPPPPAHPHHGRRSNPRSSSSAAAPPAGVTDASVPQLVQEIQEKLTCGAVECMICYDMVRRSAAVWSCSSCFSIFHLPCIKKWARSPSAAAGTAGTAAAVSDDWRCPGCQTVQHTSATELVYTCFCGRRPDPPTDYYITPHSCGEPCCKSLDRTAGSEEPFEGQRCPHICVLQCHPGPCPPCQAFAPRRPCPCGKKTVVRRCAERHLPLTCGQICGRLLSCGRHTCERICHSGACSPCPVLVNASCFCSKKTEMIICGDMLVSGVLRERDGVFQCGLICGKTLDCGNHQCIEECHPGPCGGCMLVPQEVRTCHCGGTPLLEERKSCLDTIPTCMGVCKKLLPCGIHHCAATCHGGSCPSCSVIVNQKCRCGSSSQTVECFKTSEEASSFVCEKPCGRKKGCGRHRCSERCCPLSKSVVQNNERDWDPHLCSIPCGKRLRCGQHSCELLCHSGHCPPCLHTIFTDLTCACGQTFIPPPLPCGTPPPSCTHTCLVPQPCGHSAPHTCHFGDCPPCSVPISKECTGGHVLLRNVPCGSKDIRCNQLCGKTRQCGVHACARPCHPPPCDMSLELGSSFEMKLSCRQVCGAPRRDCKHSCTASCHPSSPCPIVKCEFPVTITCSCGRLTAAVPCGAGGTTTVFQGDTLFETSILQKLPATLLPLEANGTKVPFGQRKLSCSDECAKLERKRALAEAFDITPNLDNLHLGEHSAASELLSDLIRREPKWVQAVEDRFKYLVLGKFKGTSLSNIKVHVFCHMVKEKRDAVKFLAERWKLSVQAAGWEPKRFVIIHVTPKSKPPVRIIGSKPGIPMNCTHPPTFDSLVDMDPKLVVSMLDLPGDADISTLVLRFGGECELVWLNDKNALAVFNDPIRAATALRRLDNGSVYYGAITLNGAAGTSTGSNPWAGGGGVTSRSDNPWKKALASEINIWEGEWSSGLNATAPVWKGCDNTTVSVSSNRCSVLDSSEATNSVASFGPSAARNVADSEGSNVEEKVTFSVLEPAVCISAGEGTCEDTVDDWEEAYEPKGTHPNVEVLTCT